MFARRQQPPALKLFLTFLSLSLLASCSNSAALESFVNADPQLRTEETTDNSLPDSSDNNPQNESEINTQTQNNQTNPEPEITAQPQNNQTNPKSEITANVPSNSLLDLPEEIPQAIPLYPQSQLQQVEPELTTESGSLLLRSPDNPRVIADYYQEQLQAQEWEILRPFSLENNGVVQSAIASKDNLKIKISLADSPINNTDSGDNNPQTDITIAYNPDSQVAPNVSEVSPNEPEVKPDITPVTNSVTDFSDLEEVPEQLQLSVKEVAALGILTPQTQDTLDKFSPNELVTRRDYARWLVSANNKIHDNSPGKKIHLASKTNQIAFRDIDVKDPDFGEIQGLAEAGLIPSILTNDSNNVLFRPDATLTREDLVTWKVPLDVRAALAKASIETIKETWGFQDAAKIDPLAIKSLFSDYQNGDRANVRRIFGYTTLFQPKKGVTRAEAAASLWYFGHQGDGISAEELLENSIN